MSVFLDIVDLAGPPSGDGHGTFNGQQTDIAAQQVSLASDAGAEFDPLAITNPDNFASWDHPRLKSAADSLDAEVMHGTGDGWGDMGKYLAGDMRGLELALRSAIAGEWAGRGANQAATAGNAYTKQGAQLGAAIMLTSTKIHEAAVAAAQTKVAVPPPVPIDNTHAVLTQMANPLNPQAMAQDLEVQHRAAEDARAEAVRVMESHYLPVYQASDVGVPVLPLPRGPVSVGTVETPVGSGGVVGSSSLGDNSQWSAPTHSAAWTDPSGTSAGVNGLAANPGGGSAGVGSNAGAPYGSTPQYGVGGYGSGSAGASGGDRPGTAAGVTRGAGGYGPGSPGIGGASVGSSGQDGTAGYPGLGTSRVTAAGAGGGVPGAYSGVGTGYGLGPEGDGYAAGSRGGAYGRGGGAGPSASGGSFGPGSGGSAGGAYGPGGYGAGGYGAGGSGAGGSGAGGSGAGGSGAGGSGAGGSGAGGYGPGRSGSNLGRGPTSGVGAGTGSAAEGGAARGAAATASGRGATGAGGMGGMGGGRGKGEDDYEHNTPSYLITQEHGSELVGPLPPVSPAVIGE